MSIIRLNINGFEMTGQDGQTILDVARANGIEIPTLCHDDRVKSYGACGVCVVEVEGMPKLLRSCSTAAADGMIIKTNTEKVKNTRRTALELLLSDHTGDCRPPCALACPAQTDCQGYVGLIANGQYKEAVKLIKDKIPLPASIGRVCPHPCETACRRELVEEPIDIAHLKQFAADKDLFSGDIYKTDIAEDTGKSVAIVGGGPGGLTAAYFLRKKGHEVTIYDAMPKMGGMLVYGIPEYRLPKAIVEKETKVIEDMGVKFVNGVRIGKDLTFEYLKERFDCVVAAIGAWTSVSLRCPGEELDGVIGGIDFLRDVTLNNTLMTGRKIAVVGGGNTAMDACRTAVRLGASEVYNIYRRTKLEMPAEAIEIEEAEEEGVIFKNLTNPIEIIGENNRVSKIRLQIMELGEPDESGRRSPVAVEGEEETIDVDTVIIAIGQGIDASGFEGLNLTGRGTLAADEKTFRTNIENVFAVGDATNKGADIAISAIGEAKKASGIIDAYLNGESISYIEPFLVKRDSVTAETLSDRVKESRVTMRHLSAASRKDNFHEVNKGFTDEEAVAEAKRCLECGCHDYFECKLIDQANQYNVKPKKFDGERHNRVFEDNHPFIKRNPDKCILCGLCVRICDETMSITALGLVDRGFDTVVKPALELPLRETGCISCGQCVNVCPTGALIETTGAKKQVPVKEDFKDSVCSYCGLGCATKTATKGGMILRSLPNTEINDKAILCSKGRFGIANPILNKKKRLTKPLIRKDGVLVEVDFQEAYIYISKKLQGISARYGANSIAVAVSDQYVNEDIFAIKKYAEEIIKTENIVSFNMAESGLKQTLGYDSSTTVMDELMNSDVIFVIENDILKSHTIGAVKIKQRVEEGAKLITLNDSETYLDGYAEYKLKSVGNLSLLKQFAKALIDMGLSPENAEGFIGFKQYVGVIEVEPEVQKAAELYAIAKSAVIVFEQNAISTDAAKLISAIAIISNHIGRARNGIVQLKPNVNSQGLADMGIMPATDGLKDEIASQKIKGMMVFGEDIPEIDLSGLEFLIAADTYLTETAEKADVILPFSDLLRTSGTITNSFRKMQKVTKVLEPASGQSNIEIIKCLANISNENFVYRDEDDLLREISQTIPEYKNAWLANKPVFISKAETPILYTDCFNFENGKAKLLIPENDNMYQEVQNTYWAFKKFSQFIEEEKVIYTNSY